MSKGTHPGKATAWLRRLAAAVCWLCMLPLLPLFLGNSGASDPVSPVSAPIRGAFVADATGRLQDILGSIIPIDRVYTLNDHDLVAPEPDPACFGQATDPSELSWLLEEAADLLGGQTTLFTTQTPIKPGSVIEYYFDDTILVICWKQVVDNGIYAFSEVKIAHPSQFRRFMTEGKYGSGVSRTTQEMAKSVNAVVASSGDYYGHRYIGIVVNEGYAYRGNGHLLDTCYIDPNGDFLFTYAGEITGREAAQAFVDEHDIRFTLSFGPVMVRGGENVVPVGYNSGYINRRFARSVICQWDSLHYLLVAANMEPGYPYVPTVKEMAQNLADMGIPTAYGLDGGQTSTLVMGGEVFNTVSYGAQRNISDIVYFATAMPEEE